MNILERKFTGYCVDTRCLKPGDLFFALKGARTDGHDFLKEAVEKGASAAVVSNDFCWKDSPIPLIPVENVLETLQSMASRLLENLSAQVVGVTGSIGKTTTKDFLTTILREKYRVYSSAGNQNSQIGLPLSLLNHIQGDEEVVILEMSMTHPGNIANLVKIAPPDIALITTTALTHAENFESLAHIGRCKAEIFSHPKTRLGILSRDIENFEELCLIGSCEKCSFSIQNEKADFYLDEKTLPLAIPGHHNRHNFLAAATVARNLRMDWETIRKASAKLQLPERRMQKVVKQGVTFINDTYNACEPSMKAALKTLPETTGRKFAFLAEMPELGKFSELCHQNVGKFALEHVDFMLCFGEKTRPIYDVWMHAGKPVILSEDKQVLIQTLKNEMREGDVVLLKGANSKQMWKILEEV